MFLAINRRRAKKGSATEVASTPAEESSVNPGSWVRAMEV